MWYLIFIILYYLPIGVAIYPLYSKTSVPFLCPTLIFLHKHKSSSHNTVPTLSRCLCVLVSYLATSIVLVPQKKTLSTFSNTVGFRKEGHPATETLLKTLETNEAFEFVGSCQIIHSVCINYGLQMIMTTS